MNRLMNQACRVKTRLFTQCDAGLGKRTHGRVNATAIKGIPI